MISNAFVGLFSERFFKCNRAVQNGVEVIARKNPRVKFILKFPADHTIQHVSRGFAAHENRSICLRRLFVTAEVEVSSPFNVPVFPECYLSGDGKNPDSMRVSLCFRKTAQKFRGLMLAPRATHLGTFD